MMGLSFMTERGIESYQYDWTQHPDLDGSKPLGLLKHLDGNPLLAVAVRQKNSPQQYDFLAKWVKKAYVYVEDLAKPHMEEEEREEFEKAMELVVPLAKRADKATREMLLPALADGQIAVVLDRKLESKQFINALPETEKPMPMVEPALLLGVSDKALLLKAFDEYVDVAREFLDKLREMEDAEIPDEVRIPEPQIETITGSQVYSFPLPVQWGVDEQIVPNGAFKKDVAVFSLSHDHSQRLLKKQSLEVGGVLIDTDRPLAMAFVFDFAGLIETTKPWINLAIDKATEDQEAQGQIAAVKYQVETVLSVLQALRTITAESYFEGDAFVTHTLTEVEDLK
jgi:hypothetical protein